MMCKNSRREKASKQFQRLEAIQILKQSDESLGGPLTTVVLKDRRVVEPLEVVEAVVEVKLVEVRGPPVKKKFVEFAGIGGSRREEEALKRRRAGGRRATSTIRSYKQLVYGHLLLSSGMWARPRSKIHTTSLMMRHFVELILCCLVVR